MLATPGMSAVEPRCRRPIPIWLHALGVMTLIGLGSALWWGPPVYRQQRLIREIERGGGYVVTSQDLPGWLPAQWEVRLAELFSPVTYVNLGTGDEKTIAMLSGFPQLNSLDISRISVTDACLEEAGRFKNLLAFGFAGPHITDANLRHLAGMTNLVSLRVNAAQVTDAGLIHLAGLKALTQLDLSHTQLSDAGIAEIVKLSDLQSLELGSTLITDEGLSRLHELRSLEHVDLSGTSVSDSGVTDLKKIRKLKSVYLVHSAITADGVAELRHRFPAIYVDIVDK